MTTQTLQTARRRCAVSILAVALGLTTWSCSSDPDPEHPIIHPSDTSHPDTASDVGASDVADSDAARDAGTDADDVEAGVDVADVGPDTSADVDHDVSADTGPDADPDSGPDWGPCGPVIDLGPFGPDEYSTAVTVNFEDVVDRAEVQCPNSVEGTRQAALAFSLPLEGKLTVTSSAAVAMETRTDLCGVDGLVLGCMEDDFSVFMIPFEQLYLIVHPLDATGQEPVELEISWTPYLACDDEGAIHCVDESALGVCLETLADPHPLGVFEYPCPMGCSEGSCVGDSCENPIVVLDRIEVRGVSLSFTNAMSPTAEESCRDDAQEHVETPGEEIVFALPDLVAGNTIFVDASGDEIENQIFVKQDCDGASACVAVTEAAETLSWVVPEDGTYYVIIDRRTTFPDFFHYIVEVQ